MGDPEIAKAFLKYAITHYPAKHYCTGFMGHAGGGGGFCTDHGDDHDKITTAEMGEILREIRGMLDHNIDIFSVTSCWFGTVEKYYEMAPYVDYALSSQKLMVRMDYRAHLAYLKRNPEAPAKDIVSYWVNHYNHDFYWSDDVYVIAGFDLSQMDVIKDKVDEFARALMTYDQSKVAELRKQTQRCDTDTYRDLYHFAELATSIPELREAAEVLMRTIETTRLPEDYMPPEGNYHGMSIYFPREAHSGYFSYRYHEYKAMRFSLDTAWDEFLDTFMLGGMPIEFNSPLGNTITIPEGRNHTEHYYAMNTVQFNGRESVKITLQSSELAALEVGVLLDFGDYYHEEWHDISEELIHDSPGIWEIPAEKLQGERELRVIVRCRGAPGTTVDYTIELTRNY
jgi:hypothetical protein